MTPDAKISMQKQAVTRQQLSCKSQFHQYGSKQRRKGGNIEHLISKNNIENNKSAQTEDM
jgi:hypothetical protein